MKQRVFSLILVICMLSGLCLPVSALSGQEEVQYRYIANAAAVIDDLGDIGLLVQLVDTTGKIEERSFAKNFTLNQTSYALATLPAEDVQEIAETISASYASLVLDEDGAIVQMQCAASFTSYTAVAYNQTAKTFGDISNTAGLPVYYLLNGSFRAPYLAEEYLYDIQVYEYAVLVTGYSSKSYAGTITDVEFTMGMNSDFVTQTLDASVTVSGEDAYTLHGRLYDQDGEIAVVSSGNNAISFEGIPNADAEYQLNLWLTDAEGEPISDVQTRAVTVKEIAVERRYIFRAAVQAAGWNTEEGFFVLAGEDVLYFAPEFYLNDTYYPEGSDLEALISVLEGNYASFTLDENGEINRIGGIEPKVIVNRVRFFDASETGIYESVTGEVYANVWLTGRTGAEVTVYLASYTARGVLSDIVIHTVVCDGTKQVFSTETVSAMAAGEVKVFAWSEDMQTYSAAIAPAKLEQDPGGVAVIQSVETSVVGGNTVIAVNYYKDGELLEATVGSGMDSGTVTAIQNSRLGDVWKLAVSDGVITDGVKALTFRRENVISGVDYQLGLPGNSQEEYGFGAVVDITSSGKIWLSDNYQIRSSDVADANIYIVDPKQEGTAQLYLGTLDDIIFDDTLLEFGMVIELVSPAAVSGVSYTITKGDETYTLLDYVFVCYENNNPVDIVIYQPHNYRYRLR